MDCRTAPTSIVVKNSILFVLPQGHNYMGARKGRWKTPLLFCKHHNFLAILFCQNFTTCLKFEYTDDISSHNFESALRLIMTYGFKLVMIGNMCTRLQAVQNIQFHFQNFECTVFLFIFHTKKYLWWCTTQYVLHKSEQKPGTGGQLFLTSVCYVTHSKRKKMPESASSFNCIF